MDRNVDSCKIEIDKDCMKLSFQVHFIQGYTKNFFLSVSENETVQVKLYVTILLLNSIRTYVGIIDFSLNTIKMKCVIR